METKHNRIKYRHVHSTTITSTASTTIATTTNTVGMSVALQTTKKFAAFSVPGTTTSKDVPAAASGSKMAQSSKNNKAAVNSSSKQQATPAAASVSTSSASVSAPTVDIEALILSTLASTNEIADTWQFAQQHSLDHQEVVGAIKSLLVDAYVADSPLSATIWSVSEEGTGVLQNGSPEIQVLRAVIAAGSLSIASLNSQLGEVAKIGMGVCMKNKWIAKNGENVDALVHDVQDETANLLQQVQSTSGQGMNTNDLNNLKKRKLVQQVTRKSYRITKGVDFREKRVRKVADLTKAMLGKKEEVAIIILLYIVHNGFNTYYFPRNRWKRVRIGVICPSNLLI